MRISIDGKILGRDKDVIDVLNEFNWSSEDLSIKIIELREELDDCENTIGEKDVEIQDKEDDMNELKSDLQEVKDELDDERENGLCSQCNQLKNLGE